MIFERLEERRDAGGRISLRHFAIILGVFLLLSVVVLLTFLCGPDDERVVRFRFLLIPFLLAMTIWPIAALLLLRGPARENGLMACWATGVLLWYVAECVHFSFFTVDDAWISARYGHTLAAVGRISWNPGAAPVEGYTNFLWVILAALAEGIGWDPIILFKFTGILLGAGTIMGIMLATKERYGAAAGVLSGALVSFQPRWALHSVSGLETVAFAGLMLGLVVAATQGPPPTHFSWYRYAGLALLGLFLSWTRPEGVWVSALCFMVAWIRCDNRKRMSVALMIGYVVPGLLYMAWRLWHFQDFFPNTFYAKVASEDWNWPGITSFLSRVPWIGVSAVLSSVIACRAREQLAWLIIFSLALFYSRTFLIMNYFDRFFFPLLPLMVLCCAPFLAWLWRRARAARRKNLCHAIWAYGVVGMMLVWGVFDRKWVNYFVEDYGQLMRHVHIPLGKALSSVRGARVAVGDAGAIPYYSQANCIDFLGLNDRTIARMIWDRRFDVGMPPYVFGQKPDALILVSSDRVNVQPISFSGPKGAYWLFADRASYVISTHQEFSEYSRIHTYQHRPDSKYCVQVWLRLSSPLYHQLEEALTGRRS